MKKKIKNLAVALAFALAVGTTAPCATMAASSITAAPAKTTASKWSWNFGTNKETKVLESKQSFKFEVLYNGKPVNTNVYDVAFKTSNSNALYISQTGEAKANKAGKLTKTTSCTVTATITNKKTEKQKVLTANVIIVLNGAVGIKISNTNIAKKAISIGDTLDFNSYLLNKDGKKISNKKPALCRGWFTSNDKIATVDLINGIVTGKANGKATITVATFKNATDRKIGLSKAIATDNVTVTVSDTSSHGTICDAFDDSKWGVQSSVVKFDNPDSCTASVNISGIEYTLYYEMSSGFFHDSKLGFPVQSYEDNIVVDSVRFFCSAVVDEYVIEQIPNFNKNTRTVQVDLINSEGESKAALFIGVSRTDGQAIQFTQALLKAISSIQFTEELTFEKDNSFVLTGKKESYECEYSKDEQTVVYEVEANEGVFFDEGVLETGNFVFRTVNGITYRFGLSITEKENLNWLFDGEYEVVTIDDKSFYAYYYEGISRFYKITEDLYVDAYATIATMAIGINSNDFPALLEMLEVTKAQKK